MTGQESQGRDPRRDEVIAGEYVLGVLSAEDRRKVEARLASDRQFAAMVNRWEENLSGFNDDYDVVSPPPAIYASLERRIFVDPRGDAAMAGRVSGGIWNSILFWRGLALGAVAVSAVLAALSSGTFVGAPQPRTLVAELSGETTPVALLASYDGTTGLLAFTPAAARAEDARSLELWLVEGDAAPVSLGVLPQSGEGTIAVPEAMRSRLSAGAVLAVSVEPLGGSPTGTATGPVIASGTVSQR